MLCWPCPCRPHNAQVWYQPSVAVKAQCQPAQRTSPYWAGLLVCNLQACLDDRIELCHQTGHRNGQCSQRLRVREELTMSDAGSTSSSNLVVLRAALFAFLPLSRSLLLASATDLACSLGRACFAAGVSSCKAQTPHCMPSLGLRYR
jgi:hypothetical protein